MSIGVYLRARGLSVSVRSPVLDLFFYEYKCELVNSTQGKVWTEIRWDKMLKGESWGRGSRRDAGTERNVQCTAAQREKRKPGSARRRRSTPGERGKRERTAARHTRGNADG